MNRSRLFQTTCWLFLAILLTSAAPERRTRVEFAAAPLRAGTKLEEQRQMQILDGAYSVKGEGANQSVSLRFLQRAKLTRRVQSAENEEVTVEDFAQDVAFYAGMPQPVDMKAGVLNQTEMHARRRQGQWLYELQGKPTDLQQEALVKLAWMTTALDLAAAGIGTQQRTTGETWKTDFPSPRGKARELAVLSGYECTLTGVEDIQNVPHARIAIRGKISVEQPTYKGTSEVIFTGHVLRRLKDKVDVETKVEGTVQFTGPVTAAGKPATLTMKLPYNCVRTLRVLDR